jgi:cysteinyl-tRNA synthetase
MSTAVTSDETMTDNAPTQTIQIYNTLTRTKEPLEPVTPGKVGIYLCGPTVYDKAHIGHMVGPVIFDTIKRYLVYCGYRVNWVVNITDVDDKLINKANERGISMQEVAEENTADYLSNLAGMGVDDIDQMPKATETMDGIIDFTRQLIDKGFAYESEGDVFFDVLKDAEYGKLTNRSVADVQGEGGEAAARKRSPADFALWKSAKPSEPSWDSPWGPGRPGWHIECSAMSRAILGESFDIHGGGLDLIFPHHENEIAQSECCHGKPMANIWMHNGLLRAAVAGKVGGRGDREDAATDAGGKMSRSKGAGGLADLIGRQGGERIRFFLLRTHYRSTVLFSEAAIEEAGTGLDTFYRFFKRYERITGESFYDVQAATTRSDGEVGATDDKTLSEFAEARSRFLAAMDDDFNTGSAVGDLFELARTLNKYVDDQQLESADQRDEGKLEVLRQGARTLRELSGTLGLFVRPIEKAGGENSELIGGIMSLLIDVRNAARKNKNFAVADQVRDAMGPIGITLEDRANGTDWTAESGTNAETLIELMKLVIQLRGDARTNKDFATADQIRDGLTEIGVQLEDRADGTDWSVGG